MARDGAAMPGCGCPNDERASGNERADEAAADDDEYEYEPLSVCARSGQTFLAVPTPDLKLNLVQIYIPPV